MDPSAPAISTGPAPAPDSAPSGAEQESESFPPHVISLGLGGFLLFTNTQVICQPGFFECRSGSTGGGFVLSVEAGSHLVPLGRHPGVFLQGAAALSLGAAFGVRLGARLGIDIEMARFDDHTRLLASPSILLGFSAGDLSGNFALEVTGDLKLALLDGLLVVWLRPFASDMQFAGSFSWRWNLLAGAEIGF